MEKETIKHNPQDTTWEFTFENYKNFSKYNKKLADYNILIVTADNEKGKTSVITALQETYLGRSLTPEPLKRGETEGFTEIKVKDKNGNPAIVKHSFDKKDQKGKFIIVDKDGKAYNKVSDFGELLGVYFPITVQEFFDLAKTVPGRRELIDDYLMKCLNDNERKSVYIIDTKIKPTTGTLFSDRTQTNNKVDHYKSLIEEVKFSKQDNDMLENGEAAKEQLKKLKGEKDKIATTKLRKSTMENAVKALDATKENILAVLETEEDKNDIGGCIESVIMNLKDKILNIDVSEEREKFLIDKCQKGESFIENYEKLKIKDDELKRNKELLKGWEKTLKEQNEQIEELREKKKNIYKNSKLPAGLEIIGDTFTLDGFDFDDKQVSFSKASLAIIELMFTISDSKLIVGGTASEYGPDKMKELGELVEKYDRTVVLTKVVGGQTDVKIVGVIEGEVKEAIGKLEGLGKKIDREVESGGKNKSETKKESKDKEGNEPYF